MKQKRPATSARSHLLGGEAEAIKALADVQRVIHGRRGAPVRGNGLFRENPSKLAAGRKR